MGLRSHIWRVHTEAGVNHAKKLIGHKSGNQYTVDPNRKMSQPEKERLRNGSLGVLWSEERIQQHAERCKKNNIYLNLVKSWKPYTKLDGTIVNLQSSYEVKVAQSLDEQQIDWIRPSYITYIQDDVEKRYYPDFYLPDYDLYLDPKNDYLIENDIEKIRLVEEQNNITVVVLNKDQLYYTPVAQLVEQTTDNRQVTGSIPVRSISSF